MSQSDILCQILHATQIHKFSAGKPQKRARFPRFPGFSAPPDFPDFPALPLRYDKKAPGGGDASLRAPARKKVRAALLSRALERTIIAAGGLNGRVRDGNGCLAPAKGTNQKERAARSGQCRQSEGGRASAGAENPRAPGSTGASFVLRRPGAARPWPEARASFAPGPPPPRFPRSGDGPDGVQASRPIRSGRLNALRRLRLRPVKRVVFPRPSGTCVRDG